MALEFSWSQFNPTVLNFLVMFPLSSLILAWVEKQITTEAKQQITDKLALQLLCFVIPDDLILAFLRIRCHTKLEFMANI